MTPMRRCARAAFEWCLWESATPAWPPASGLAERFRDPFYAVAFARLVTHYVRHNAWLEDGHLLRNAGHSADHPGMTAEIVRATDRFGARWKRPLA